MKEKFKTLKTVHIAFCLGVAIIYITQDYKEFKNYLNFNDFDGNSLIYIGIFLFAILLSHFLYKSQVKKVDPSIPTEEKLAFYQSAMVMRWTPMEAVAIAYLFLDSNYRILGVLALLYLIFLRPTLLEFNRDFNVF